MRQKGPFSAVERLSFASNRLAERSLLCLGLVMTGVVIAQVFSRYVLNHSLFWSEELARYLLVWLTFLGTSVAYHRRIHPSIDLVFRRISPRLKLVFRLLTHLFSLVLFLVMIWYGCKFAYFVRLQTTPALALPKWLIFSIIPVSGAIMSIHAAALLNGYRREFRESK